MKADKVRTQQLIEEFASSARPGRLLPPFIRSIAWLGSALFFVVAGVVMMGLRADFLESFHDPHFLIECIITLGTAVLSAAGAFALSVPGNERNRWTRILPGVAVSAWIAFLGFQLLHSHADSDSVVHSIRHGYSCFIDIVILGMVPGIFVFAMLRRGASIQTGWSGALAMLSVAALGALGVNFICTAANVPHVLLWHFLPVILVAFIGRALGKWLLKW